MDLGETIGHEQAQNLPSLESGADVAAASLAGGVAAGAAPGVLFAGSDR